MILTGAYIVYRFFKRFPLAIVFVLLSQSCFSITMEEKVEEEVKEVKLYVSGLQDSLEEREELDVTGSSFFNKGIYLLNEVEITYENAFCKSVYHDLYILYQKISIDRSSLIKNE